MNCCVYAGTWTQISQLAVHCFLKKGIGVIIFAAGLTKKIYEIYHPRIIFNDSFRINWNHCTYPFPFGFSRRIKIDVLAVRSFKDIIINKSSQPKVLIFKFILKDYYFSISITEDVGLIENTLFRIICYIGGGGGGGGGLLERLENV